LISAGFLLSRKCLRDNDLELFYYFRDLLLFDRLGSSKQADNQVGKIKEVALSFRKSLIAKELRKKKKKVIK
jgi:hypothetical protein